jgi:hypothetical protein
MIIKVTRNIFIDEFRTVRADQFNHAGLVALFDYLDEYAHEPDIELDVIGLCCDFCQYDSIEEACMAYSLESREELNQHTVIIDCADDSVIIQNF